MGILLEAIVVACPARKVDCVFNVVIPFDGGCIYHAQR